MNNISQINSNTAKNGFYEEELCCNDLNLNASIKEQFKGFFPDDYGVCYRVPGCGKIDIMSVDNSLKIQIKKYKINQFQQVDRHWIEDLVRHIPLLKDIEHLLKSWCEIPLKECNKLIDKSAGKKIFNANNFTELELTRVLNTLNSLKKQILEFAFYGVYKDASPDYLIGVEYLKNVRHKQVAYKVHDIITYLENLGDFEFSKSRSVIKLGDAFTIQRKGGDGGKKSSNQIQMKIVLSRLKIDDRTEIKLQDCL